MPGHYITLLVTFTGQELRILVSGHFVQLSVYFDRVKKLRVLVSGHYIALLVTFTGQELRILVSGHYVGLLVSE